MNVLSLFDGKSSAYTDMELAGLPVNNYYSAEVDKFAIKASECLYPNQVRLGSVLDWREWNIDFSSIDIMFGGFPCQAWSLAGKQMGDKDERGALFWTMLDIFKHVQQLNPDVIFMMENVKMKKEFEQYITFHTEQALGHVNKHLINSALVSGQNRKRYYWTNIEGITQPEDRGILLKDILEDEVDEKFFYSQKSIDYMERGNEKWMQAGNRRADRYTQDENTPKSFTITANIHKGVPYNYFKCGAIRGRYKECGATQQQLEMRKDDKTNALTTVQKDNVVVRFCQPRQFNKDSLCHHAADATDIKGNESIKRVYADSGKAPTLTTMGGGHREPKVIVRNKSKTVRSSGRGSYDRHEWDSISNCHYRKLTPRECFRLQTVPEHFIDKLLASGLSNTQLYKIAGNGWTHEVVAHMLRFIK